MRPVLVIASIANLSRLRKTRAGRCWRAGASRRTGTLSVPPQCGALLEFRVGTVGVHCQATPAPCTSASVGAPASYERCPAFPSSPTDHLSRSWPLIGVISEMNPSVGKKTWSNPLARLVDQSESVRSTSRSRRAGDVGPARQGRTGDSGLGCASAFARWISRQNDTRKYPASKHTGRCGSSVRWHTDRASGSPEAPLRDGAATGFQVRRRPRG